eukprot:scaffold216241_cov30-Attheya_sp.AAC.1
MLDGSRIVGGTCFWRGEWNSRGFQSWQRRMSFERSVVDAEMTLQSFGQDFPPKVSRKAMYAIRVETAWVMDWIAVFQL